VTVETAKNKKDSLAFTFVHPSPPKTVDVASGLSILEDTKPSVNPESDISFSSITTTAATSDMSMESFVHSTDVWLKEVDPNHEFTSNQYAPPDQALNQRSAVPFRLRRKSVLSENVLVLEFALPTADHVLGLPTGKHVYISAMIGETKVERRYTPISSDYEAGTVKLLVQVYRPNPLFPYGGQMSQYLDQLKIGSHLDFQGPVGEFEYCSNGRLIMEGSHRIAGRLNMIASGVGITSFLHIIEKILGNKSDTTRLTLVYLAKVESELLMRSTLDKWANAQSFKFRVQYVLAERWPRGWEYSTGYARKSLFARHLFPPGNDVYNLMSCPPELSERCFPFLATLGHACDKLYSF
jgi:nitrate reductase (NAD(P)H)